MRGTADSLSKIKGFLGDVYLFRHGLLGFSDGRSVTALYFLPTKDVCDGVVSHWLPVGIIGLCLFHSSKIKVFDFCYYIGSVGFEPSCCRPANPEPEEVPPFLRPYLLLRTLFSL